MKRGEKLTIWHYSMAIGTIIILAFLFMGIQKGYGVMEQNAKTEITMLFNLALDGVIDAKIKEEGGITSFRTQMGKTRKDVRIVSSDQPERRINKSETFDQLSDIDKLRMVYCSIIADGSPKFIQAIDSLFSVTLAEREISLPYALTYKDPYGENISYGKERMKDISSAYKDTLLLGAGNEITIELYTLPSFSLIASHAALTSPEVAWGIGLLFMAVVVIFIVYHRRSQQSIKQTLNEKRLYKEKLSEMDDKILEMQKSYEKLTAQYEVQAANKTILKEKLQTVQKELVLAERKRREYVNGQHNIIYTDNDEIFYNKREGRLYYKNQPLKLKGQQSQLIHAFFTAEQYILTSDEIVRLLWKDESVSTDAIRGAIYRFRGCIESIGISIEAINTVGYRMVV